MFWTGIIIGIFIGAAIGVLVMSMAISAARANGDDMNVGNRFATESSEELSPEITEDKERK